MSFLYKTYTDLVRMFLELRVKRQEKYLKVHLTVYCLTICLSWLFCMLFCCLLFFLNQRFRKKYFRNTFRVSNSLEPDQARPLVGPDLGPNCLQRLSVDDTSRQRVLSYIILELVGIAF